MSRKTVQLLAVVVLVFLGVPFTMHIVLHDLHGPHEAPHVAVSLDHAGHGEHEHPVVPFAASTLSPPTRVALPVVITRHGELLQACAVAERNSFSVPALRLDHDVGLQALFSTFLI